jgi:bifunctional DNA primase/polymerase-like protein/primase-like protein
MLRTALALAERNIAVFPCAVRSKTPATPHGFLDASTDEGVVTRWWQIEPNYNIGIATGAISNLFVLDIDGLDAEIELRKLEAAHGTLPATVEVITGKGRHLYFRHPGKPVKNSASKLAEGLDIRGDGGFVVAPPSVHPSGKQYCWSVDSARAIASPPAWLIGMVTAPSNGNGTAFPTPPSEWCELVAVVKEGRRDCTLAKVAGCLLRRYVDPLLTLELVQALNTARCQPPLPEADVHRIVDSICGRELKRRGGNGG